MAAITITPGSVTPDTQCTYDEGTAGATITAGQACALDCAGLFQLADANSATAALRTVRGIAAHGAASGQPLKLFKTNSIVNIGATVVVGTIYVLGATPGDIAPSTDLVQGWYTHVLGIATTAGKLWLNFFAGGVAVP